MVEDRYIGLALAVSSSVAIGTSFIITKKGLNDAAKRNNFTSASDDRSYLKNPIWWAGISTMIIGEIANFAAYTFAPPILVTPLGALSVLIGAILASFLLNEELGHIGRIGCALCLLGSLIIVLHAPEDKEIVTVDEILHYALQPGFLMYCFMVLVFTLVMIYYFSPRYGQRNPLVYVSICSLVGSVSVMAIKGFGVALKLTFAGKNQLTHPSTYVFGIVVTVCILIQMNYFNKALDTFSTNVVNPMYYVCFSTATIVASLILFQGFNTTSGSTTFSLLCGFIVTFLGVHLLNLSRNDSDDSSLDSSPHALENGGIMDPRLSASRLSSEGGWPASPHAIGLNGVPGHVRRGSRGSIRGGSIGGTTLFDAEVGLPLERLREEEEESVDEDATEMSRLNPSKRDRSHPNTAEGRSLRTSSAHTSPTNNLNGSANGRGLR
ncbi:hypothetical protein M422DRAFT_217752 [Sphaerobolus stellatus SS14]|uniref:Magnesium transporter n=1 Tax=Sphaerobolus stellatus (strain SS14) TaxID=990650 RepID=A0A0C9UB80_SPHS4|nr:hypothetical protein M422DRAFT_217752 [Sphaerobolus stellatus SS14]